jgi:hypothetical protein
MQRRLWTVIPLAALSLAAFDGHAEQSVRLGISNEAVFSDLPTHPVAGMTVNIQFTERYVIRVSHHQHAYPDLVEGDPHWSQQQAWLGRRYAASEVFEYYLGAGLVRDTTHDVPSLEAAAMIGGKYQISDRLSGQIELSSNAHQRLRGLLHYHYDHRLTFSFESKQHDDGYTIGLRASMRLLPF